MSVSGIIVTYYPDERLRASIERLSGQLEVLVVVDNTPGPALPELSSNLPVKIIRNGDNLGIAAAFNIGIRYLIEHSSSDYFMLFDQDSLPGADMVTGLLNAYNKLEAAGKKVAAVGPALFDPRSGMTSGFIGFRGLRLNRIMPGPDDNTVESLFIISSGMLMPRKVLLELGDMKEGLFIDLVDVEWCFRARSAGYAVYGVADATMEHTIGDILMPYWFLRWRRRPLHSPVRIYYQLRNSLLLYRQNMPWRWKLSDSIVRMLMVYVFLFFSPKSQRGEYRHMIFRGIADGLAGKEGVFRSDKDHKEDG